MRDAIVMWRSTKMAVLAALCAAVYAALLIPFKAIPLIPGFTELRPGNVVPVVAGLLFGPAAAWGCAFGNLIGDFFGTIGPGSVFGFLGNFAYAYVPYRLWRALMKGRPATGAPSQAPVFILVAVIGSMSCGVIIGWGVDLLGLVPYQVLTTVITLNNSVASVALGLILLPLLYPRAKRWGLLYQDVMPAHDYEGGAGEMFGAILIAVGSVCGFLAALGLQTKLGDAAARGFQRPEVLILEDLPQRLMLLGGALKVLLPGWSVLFIAAGSAVASGWAGLRALKRPAKERIPWEALPEQDGPAVEVLNLSFRYAEAAEPALRGLSLAQPRGSLRMLMGPTGAGKSTLCKCLDGVIPELETGEISGEVRLLGRSIAGAQVHELAPLIGEVFQDFESQLLTTSAEAEVAFPLENLGLPPEQMGERVRQALEAVDAWELRRRDPESLSGGEKQRVALAAVLAMDPRVVVLDEPTTDLDPQGKAEFLAHCARLREQGTTLLLAEHETELARDADALTVLQGGAVAYDGPPAGLLSDPARCVELGLRPLDMPALFAALGRAERPLTVEEAIPELQGAACDEAVWERLLGAWIPGPVPGPGARVGPVALSVRGLGHTYPGGVEALKCVSFDVHEGEFVAVLGPNGSGKTTLAKHLNGLLRPTAGEVHVGDTDTRGASPAQLAARVGYVFQDPDNQVFADTVYEEVAFGPRNLGLTGDRLSDRVERALRTLGLADRRDADPFTLTKGERQQVALASVLAMRPQVIVVDEPTTGLDGPQQVAIMAALKALNELGHTILIITHCTWAAAEYAHRTILLDAGELAADAPTREVFGDPELMARTGQRAPEITALLQRLWGRTVLSVGEAVACLGGQPAAAEGGEAA